VEQEVDGVETSMNSRLGKRTESWATETGDPDEPYVGSQSRVEVGLDVEAVEASQTQFKVSKVC
jgi:hypothetical protein